MNGVALDPNLLALAGAQNYQNTAGVPAQAAVPQTVPMNIFVATADELRKVKGERDALLEQITGVTEDGKVSKEEAEELKETVNALKKERAQQQPQGRNFAAIG